LSDATVIIPAAEPCPGLDRLLGELISGAGDGSPIVEILVVDNTASGSSRIRAAVDAHSCSRFECRLIRCTVSGSYAARNAGIETARGEWLVFLDADVVPTPSWFSSIELIALRSDSPSRFTGPIVQTATGQPAAWRDRAAQALDLLSGLPQERYVRDGWAATANLVVRRRLFDAVGLFERQLESGGDFEFGLRSSRAGYDLEFVDELIVHHEARSTLLALQQKARRVVRGHRQLAELLGDEDYFASFPGNRGSLWPLRHWVRTGLGVACRPRRSDVPIPWRLAGAASAVAVGWAGLQEHRSGNGVCPDFG
jgi:GT2 family glycosyltransferase